MRTKAQKTVKKPSNQKVNLSLSSPKVVLNASECAKFLDNMGKTSVLLTEPEDKTSTVSSELFSSQSSASSLCASSVNLSTFSSLSNFVLSEVQETQSKICKNSSSQSSDKGRQLPENTDSDPLELSETTVSGNEPLWGSSIPAKTILKPPKKRRGMDKKFEDISSGCVGVYSNGNRTSSSHQTGEPLVAESCSLRRNLTDSHSKQVSRRVSTQKYSVEQLLLRKLGHSDCDNNNQTLISGNCSHNNNTRSPPSPHSLLKSLSSSPICTPINPSLSSLPSCLTNSLGRAVNTAQIFSHSYGAAGRSFPNHAYLNLAGSIESRSSILAATCVLANSFEQVPEQIEPMNLSTSCKSAPVNLGSPDVAPATNKSLESALSCTLQSSPVKDSTPIDSVSESSKVVVPLDSKHTRVSPLTIVEHAETQPASSDVSSEVHSSQSIDSDTSACQENSKPSVEDNEQSCTNIDAATSVTQTSQKSLAMVDTSSAENPEAACDLPAVQKSAGSQTDQDVAELSPPSPELLAAPVSPAPTVVSQECQTELFRGNKKSPMTDSEIWVIRKPKRPPKKKIEVPMDELSCSERLTRYSLTIDEVITNFVFVPEPVHEEFSLTEEEKAVITEQFESAMHEMSKDKASDVAATCSKTEHVTGLEVGMGSDLQLQEVKLSTDDGQDGSKGNGSFAEQASSSDKDVQQVVENIDSVLAFVAGNCSGSTSSVESGSDLISGTSPSKKAKKKNLSKGSNKSMDALDKSSNKKNAKTKILAQNITDDVVEEMHSSSSEKQQGSNGFSENSDLNGVGKSEKPKKLKKKKSDVVSTSTKEVLQSLPENLVESVQEDKGSPGKETNEASDEKLTALNKNKGDGANMDLSTESVASPSVLLTDKEILGPARADTSDIGESIASTSGGSEQDTPSHELETKDEMTNTDPQMTDRENHDTGLESGSEERPIGRYKKRLDFVKCEQCDHQARGRSALSRHMKKVHLLELSMPFRCQQCDYGTTKMASLNRHLFTHGVFPCSRCDFVASERIKLTEHTLELHKDKMDVKMCKVCNRYIKCEQATIEQHVETCQGPTPYRCTECDKEFKYASSLRVHYHTHFPDQPKRFKCEQCDYRTNYKANLHKHHKNMHACHDRDVQCPECGKLFSSEDNMRRHRKVHTLVRPFSCETCSKTFKTPGALKGHQLIHTAIRPFTCTFPGCNRNFRTPKFLKSHQEEFHRLVPKKFFCSVDGCNYSFFKRSHLKRHAITHTGERNFHCTWPGCSKSFRHADNLKVHFRSHTNERPVQCHLCDFKCKQRNSLFWHKKRVHQVIDMSVSPRPVYYKKPNCVPGAGKMSRTHSDGEETVPSNGLSEQLHSEEDTLEEVAVVSSTERTPALQSQTNVEVEESVLGSSMKTAMKSPDKSMTENCKVIGESPGKLKSGGPLSDKCQAPMSEEQGSLDLYEFRSDEESEEEKPGSFRRDKMMLKDLAPLPPPPKELLLKNEILEIKEREKKERADKKEQERLEKAERKEQEKKEKAEKKILERKARAEKKELEKIEKLKKKELEKKEQNDKKELEKKEKEEKKESEKKEREEKKELEKKEKQQKKEQEKIEKIERKEQEKKERVEKKEQMKEKKDKEKQDKSAEQKHIQLISEVSKMETIDGQDDVSTPSKEEKVSSKAKVGPSSAKKRKSPVLSVKEECLEDPKKAKRGRKKLLPRKPLLSRKPPALLNEVKNTRSLSLRRKVITITKEAEPEKPSNKSVTTKVKRVALKRTLVRKSKRKSKQAPPKRKPSARLKAKEMAKVAESQNQLREEPKSLKVEFKRKFLRKKPIAALKEAPDDHVETPEPEENQKVDDAESVKEPEDAPEEPVAESNVKEAVAQEEIVVDLNKPSPVSSEHMLQGKASPYRDYSDTEKEDDDDDDIDDEGTNNDDNADIEDIDDKSNRAPSPLAEVDHDDADTLEATDVDEELSVCKKNDESVIERPAEEFSDDEVSNDIPLTPPRAPAPPPVESSEDELEPDPEPELAPFSVPGPNTPFSVPGPNTPFSVPGPNTPFSIPPPTNLIQQHSVHSEEAPASAIASVPSMDTNPQGSVDMQPSMDSVEMHSHGSVEMNHSHGSVEMNHSHGSVEMSHGQGSVEMAHSNHHSVDMRLHHSVDLRSLSSVDMSKPRGSVEMLCPDEALPHADQQVRSPERGIRDMPDKYELPASLQEQTQTTEADKEYFDQYLKRLSAANNQAAENSLGSSPSGLQQLEAMVGKSHLDMKEMNSKSPISCLPTSVITSLESSLPLIPHGDLRARMDAFVSDRHHESLYARETPSALSRLPDRQTPLPHSSMGHSPAFDPFTSFNPLHPAATSSGRDNSYLRQPENLFPTPPGSTSFMAEAMFQRQAMTTPFLPPQPSDRNSLSRIPDAMQLRSAPSSSLLRRSGTVPSADMFSTPSMTQGVPRHPFANAWTGQEVRSGHWQTPYLSHQPNMATTGPFFPTKENYLTGREFMFDPSVRQSAERSMFPSLSSSQGQESFQLDRFDLSNYFPNAMNAYGSSPGSLEYGRSAHAAPTKSSFDDRYRQTASASIPDFRSLPAAAGSADMFPGLPTVNAGLNFYPANPMSYHHAQHMTESMNSAFLTHPTTPAQHAMFERDYAAATAHRSFYPQNTPYPFVDERQYSGASKLGHAHAVAPTSTSQERELMSRSSVPESQMQDPYRSLLYRY